jgi:hypothetical protein
VTAGLAVGGTAGLVDEMTAGLVDEMTAGLVDDVTAGLVAESGFKVEDCGSRAAVCKGAALKLSPFCILHLQGRKIITCSNQLYTVG